MSQQERLEASSISSGVAARALIRKITVGIVRGSSCEVMSRFSSRPPCGSAEKSPLRPSNFWNSGGKLCRVQRAAHQSARPFRMDLTRSSSP
jgi:hypothetical protein